MSRLHAKSLVGGTINRKVGSGSLQHLSGTATDAMREQIEGVLHNGGAASAAKIRDFP